MDNDGVTAFVESARSTSVGDVILSRGTLYVVKRDGFDTLYLP